MSCEPARRGTDRWTCFPLRTPRVRLKGARYLSGLGLEALSKAKTVMGCIGLY